MSPRRENHPWLRTTKFKCVTFPLCVCVCVCLGERAPVPFAASCRKGIVKLNIYFQEFNYRTIEESAANNVSLRAPDTSALPAARAPCIVRVRRVQSPAEELGGSLVVYGFQWRLR